MDLSRVEGEIVIDGRPDEAAWQRLPLLPMVQHWPVFQGEMSVRTEIRIGYDDEFLYAAGWFQDDPGRVRGNSLRRDRWAGDDVFDLIIDSFNDDQTGLKFTTTPLGILIDEEVRNDAQPGGEGHPLNRNWNTFWDASSTIDDQGWYTEVRIPLASLGFSVRDGGAEMGIIAGRYLASRDERHIYPAIPPEWDLAAFKPSLARDLRLTGIHEQKPLWITPYTVAGAQRLRDPGAPIVHSPSTDFTQEAGLDVKYGISSNLTLDLTLNTDFAQAESDDVPVNLDRFSVFQQDKRQFFQERSSAFSFDSRESMLFHSRRVGLSETGSPLRILGGARVVGRLGGWDTGFLSMQVEGDGVRPGENVGVARLNRTFGRSQQFGGMLTSRIRNDGSADLSVGLDGRFAVGSDLVTLQFAQTRNDGDPDFTFSDRSMARLFWERRRLDGFAYEFDLMRSGAGYDPALGFEFRDDFRSFKSRLRYSWQPGGDAFVRRATVIATTRAFVRNADDRLDSGLLRARAWVNLRGGHFMNLAVNFTREDVRNPFSIGADANVGAGRYDNVDVFFRFNANDAANVGTAFVAYMGGAYDGRRRQLTLEPWWRLGQHLTLGGEFSWNRLDFEERGESVNADYARLRVSAALDTRLSAETFVQYSALDDLVSTNFRMRYRFAEGRDLYLVLVEGRDLDDRFGPDSAILGRTDRRLLIKYSWAFRP